MGHRLFAVLVPASVTTTTVGPHLHTVLGRLLRNHTIDGYRVGGQVTGGWDPGYDPATDPGNWRCCLTCSGSARHRGTACAVCADAVPEGRTPGTVLAMTCDWQPHPGDIVALTRLLDPAWRFPQGRTPIAWADPSGVVWLDTEIAMLTGTDTGDLPSVLRQVLDDLHTGRRRAHPRGQRPRPFDPGAHAVAVVDTHS